MKTTDFLKKYSLINNAFIDDFYSFYDEGKNEFDYTISLKKLAVWLDIKKFHLFRLLQSNFQINKDYIILDKKKDVKGIGKGKNNVKTIMLRYSSAKELTMISRSEKASIIRNFYIEIESLLIKYKESIIRDLNQQLGINETNKQLIQKHKNKGLLYVLQIDDSENIQSNEPMEVKIGSTNNLEERINPYNIGRTKQLKIVFIYLTDQITELETCIKQNLKFYQIKHKTETFEVDLDFIKETIKYCTLKNALLLKKNNKLLNNKNDKKFLIIIDKDNIESLDKIVGKIDNKKISKISKTSKTSKISKTSKAKTSKPKTSKNIKKPKTPKNIKKPKISKKLST